MCLGNGKKKKKNEVIGFGELERELNCFQIHQTSGDKVTTVQVAESAIYEMKHSQLR